MWNIKEMRGLGRGQAGGPWTQLLVWGAQGLSLPWVQASHALWRPLSTVQAEASLDGPGPGGTRQVLGDLVLVRSPMTPPKHLHNSHSQTMLLVLSAQNNMDGQTADRS